MGSGLFELGLAAPNPVDRFPEIRGIVEELASRTDDTAYLMLRSREDALCLWRAEGGYHIKANVVALGDRRPLAASVAGLAILGSLPEVDADALLDLNMPQTPDFCSLSPSEVREHIRRCRKQGYVFARDAVMQDVTAIGMSIPARYGLPFLAVSVSAISSRIPIERIPDIMLELKRTTARIAACIDGPN